MDDVEKLLALCERASPHTVLKFGVATIQGPKGYTWGQVATDSEETMRILNGLWNGRQKIAEILRNHLLSKDASR